MVVYGWTEDGRSAADFLATRLVAELGKATAADPDGGSSIPVVIQRGRLNEPLLKVKGRTGPGFSLSRSGGLLYGAVAEKGRIGCDCALAEEFQAPYPFRRIFTEHELTQAGSFCGAVGSGAALLWSLKEAAVKAIGTGFHLIDPLDVRVDSFTPAESGCECRITARQVLRSWSEPVRDGWLSLAVVP